MDNAVEYLKDNIEPLQILNYYNFEKITEHDSEIRACCGIHGGDNAFGFVWNKRNNLWYCYTGECGGGDVFDLIQKIEGVDFKEAVKKAASIMNIDVSGMTIKKNNVLSEQKKWLNKKLNSKHKQNNFIMPNFQPITNETDVTRIFVNLNKKFSIDILKNYGAKATTIFPTEKGLLKNKLVIPLVKNKTLQGVALRDSTGKYQPKWLYQPEGIKIKDFLYNWDIAVETIDLLGLEEIILVEGIFDVWAYHEIGVDNVIAVMGSSVSDFQFSEILKLGVDVTLSFDNDTAGIKCRKKCLEQFKNKLEVKIIELPEGKDPGDLTKEELRKQYLQRGKTKT